MLVLVIDTSSAATTAALVAVSGGFAPSLVARQLNVDARAHGEVLAPAIAACLAEVGAAPAELAAIVAGTGPGPYTGLRVGLVTAAAFGHALSVPTYGVCSLDGIGAALTEPRLLAAGDARRREIYWAAYTDGVRTAEPEVAKPADVATAGFTACAGAGARLYADLLGLPLRDLDYPDPVALARVAADRIQAGVPSETLIPLYLRRPDAVEPAARKPVRT